MRRRSGAATSPRHTEYEGAWLSQSVAALVVYVRSSAPGGGPPLSEGADGSETGARGARPTPSGAGVIDFSRCPES
jgi:hypothetical protein